ncbi:MAG: three-Cys-motif partner protein TcmP [Pseudomonadota bacterium]
MITGVKYDEIGPWSEVKLEIIRDYAAAYSRILSAQKDPTLYHVYIDAFAGAGRHISKTTGEFVLGSPTNALLVKPPFREYHLIDLDKKKAAELLALSQQYESVNVYDDDCNDVLLETVFPKARYEDYRRALCILDPYGLHLNWKVIYTAGKMQSIDIFLNFPVMDINMNVAKKNPDKVQQQQAVRLTSFWGDESWKDDVYISQPTLFGDELVKQGNEKLAEAFRQRLKHVAGFKFVPKPLAMRNSTNAIVYYLYFASHKVVAKEIVEDIFGRYSKYNR